MPLIVKDRVQETTTTSGTGTITLAGAVSGFQSFAAIGNGNTTYYTIVDGTSWEVGIGTYTSAGTTLSRDTVLSNSLGTTAKISLSGGTSQVFVTYAADKAVYEDASNNVILPGTLTSTGEITPSVTASSTDLTLSAISTGVVNISTLAGKAFSVTDHPYTAGGANVNFTRAFGGQAGYTTGLMAQGSDSNVTFAFSAKGTSGIEFWTANLGERQFVVSRTASAVNYVQVTGGATGNNPTISAQGSDATRGLTIQSKGAADIAFANGSGQWGLYVTPVANTSNQLGIVSAVAGASPSIRSAGSDTNIDLTLTAKGSGQIKATNASNSILSINSTGAYGALQISSATGNNNYIFGYINNTEVGRVTMNSSNQISFATSSAATEQFRILHTASAVNYVSLYGSTTGNSGGPVIIPGGSDAAIPLTISTKSYGSLILNKNRDATNTSQYLMNNVGGLTTDGSGGAFWRGFHQGGITYTVSGVNQFIRLASYHELNSLTDPTTKNWYITLGNTTSPTNLVLANNTGAPIDFRYGAAAGSDLSFRVATPLTTDRNYLQVAGAATTLAPILSAQGSDTNISMAFQPKGTGAIDLAAGSSGVNISNGGTVTAVTRTAGGSGYTSIPTVNITAPTTAGGVQATASFLIFTNAVSINSGGTGYTVNDVLTVVGGTPSGSAAQITVTSVSAGVITGATVSGVNYSVMPPVPASVTGGTGSGATFTVSGVIQASATITNAGSGYIEQPTVTFSGGGGSGASAYATVGTTPIIKSLGNTLNVSTDAGIQFSVVGAANSNSYAYASGGTNAAGMGVTSASANAGYIFTTKGSGNFDIYTNGYGSLAFRASHTASAVNYVQVTGAATSNIPNISAQGSDTNISLSYTSKGIGAHRFQIGSGEAVRIEQFGTTAVVNRFSMFANVSGGGPMLTSRGSDTNVGFDFSTQGTGIYRFYTNTASNGTGAEQLRINHTASAVNYLQATGSAAGSAPVFSVAGTDTNIDLALTPKGTGGVAINSAIKLGAGASAGTSGQVLTSAGAGASPTWSSVSGSGGMISLGTINLSGTGNQFSLTGLTLTSYKQLYITLSNVTVGTTSGFSVANTTGNQTANNGFTTTTTAFYYSGNLNIDLNTGLISAIFGDKSSTNSLIRNATALTLPVPLGTSLNSINYNVGPTAIGTASTAVYFWINDAATKSGTITVYGVS